MEDVISRKMGRKVKYIIGEALVEMLRKSQVKLLYLAKEYKRESHELSVLRKSPQRLSKEKHKPEIIILEQSNNKDHLSVHEPSTNKS